MFFLRTLTGFYAILFAIGSLEGPIIQLDALAISASFIIATAAPRKLWRTATLQLILITGMAAILFKLSNLIQEHTSGIEIALQTAAMAIGLALLGIEIYTGLRDRIHA